MINVLIIQNLTKKLELFDVAMCRCLESLKTTVAATTLQLLFPLVKNGKKIIFHKKHI
jgi:hypothetical protein